MPRLNRSEICSTEEVQIFHLVNRCVRRTYLCGYDKDTGRDYSHRREWVCQRLEELAAIFGLDILSFAVLSNHLHIVVRTRPDVVKSWTDMDVARRWWNLFPQRRNIDQSPAEPRDEELSAICTNTSGLNEKRKRLSSISWFMRCVAEPIARRGNRDDNVTGRFWEGRFKAQVLLDETAIAACMAYVDLNPIRAGLATTPEGSDCTSVKNRIEDRCSQSEESSDSARDQLIEHGPKAGWLAPLPLDPPHQQSRELKSSRRASNKGCLTMTLDQYLHLLDWTGRQIRLEGGGRIPEEFAPILERLECSVEVWLHYVCSFHKVFRNEAGLVKNCRAFRGQRRLNRARAIIS